MARPLSPQAIRLTKTPRTPRRFRGAPRQATPRSHLRERGVAISNRRAYGNGLRSRKNELLGFRLFVTLNRLLTTTGTLVTGFQFVTPVTSRFVLSNWKPAAAVVQSSTTRFALAVLMFSVGRQSPPVTLSV